MASLYEDYEVIAHKIDKINKEIAKKREAIASITSRRTDELPARIANLEDQLKKIDEYKLKVEGFRQLAEKNISSRNVLTIEAPEGYRVNLNRLRTWAMMIDPQSTDDPYAQRVYLVSKCDLYFLECKKTEFEKRLEELKADLENGSVDEMKSLENEISKLEIDLKNYVESDEVTKFAEKVKEENEKFIYPYAPEKYVQKKQDPSCWVIGSAGYSLNANQDCNKRLKAALGAYYNEESAEVFLPVKSITSAGEFAMSVTCMPARKRITEMDAGIRAFLFNVIDKSITASRKVYIIDAERQNSALVGSLKVLEGSEFLNVVPRNAESIASTLEQLVSSFSDMDEILDNFDTVVEYNASVEEDKKIQRSVIVLAGYPDAFEPETSKYVKKILSNYERYGISLIVVQITSEQSEDKLGIGLSEYAGEEVINIRMKSGGNTIKVGRSEAADFCWYPFKHSLNSEYVAFLKGYTTGTAKKGTVYTKRVDMDNIPPYTRGNKNVDVPYGVDSLDNMHSISFENENFASYLMGASGSGKSTLLHTIITGIIRNYHPDDVELWLADFKMSEFAQYINPLPPHVKYILLDESKELVFDLIDRLTDKMMERQRFFMQNRDLKKVENVPVSTYMPVIFVILDEFSIMSQAVAEDEGYKLKLQNLLAKGRALGIKFIFSSQTYTKGIAGLTSTAKEQIQARIAMKNSNDEITSTLELSSANKTEQVKSWIDALPPHYALIKYRDEDHTVVNRLKVMYFDGRGSEAFAPQRRMIKDLNDKMKAVSPSEYNSGNSTYVEKNPVIIDGNSYSAFDIKKIEKAREKYTNAGGVFQEDIFLSLGDPRRLVSYKFVSLSKEARENMLLVGRTSESECSMSIISSTMEQFEYQGGKVHIWAYSRNRLYCGHKDGFKDSVEICEGSENVSIKIRELKEKIVSQEEGKDLFVLLGMEQMCSDFDIMPSTTEKISIKETIAQKEIEAEKEAEQVIIKATNFEAVTEEELEEINRMNEEEKELKEFLDSKEEELLESGMDVSELLAEMERQEKEFLAKHQKKSKKSSKKKTSAQNAKSDPEVVSRVEEIDNTENDTKEPETKESEGKATKEKDPDYIVRETYKPYNAKSDLKEILNKGSRYGYHFLLFVNSVADLKSIGTDARPFNHKLAFQMSADDSTLLFSSKIASKLPERICQYSNGMETYSFRPYLCKGSCWDGWDIDDNGTAIDPSILQN